MESTKSGEWLLEIERIDKYGSTVKTLFPMIKDKFVDKSLKVYFQ